MTKTIVHATCFLAIAGVTAVLLLAMLDISTAAESVVAFAIWAVVTITTAAIGVTRTFARRGK